LVFAFGQPTIFVPSDTSTLHDGYADANDSNDYGNTAQQSRQVGLHVPRCRQRRHADDDGTDDQHKQRQRQLGSEGNAGVGLSGVVMFDGVVVILLIHGRFLWSAVSAATQ
jgi:hypothetical protein